MNNYYLTDFGPSFSKNSSTREKYQGSISKLHVLLEILLSPPLRATPLTENPWCVNLSPISALLASVVGLRTTAEHVGWKKTELSDYLLPVKKKTQKNESNKLGDSSSSEYKD